MEENKKIRYSDAELEEFRSLIENKIARLESDIAGLKERRNLNDEGNTLSMFSGDACDRGRETLFAEDIERELSQKEILLEKLYAALFRVENKTFGICRETGELIPKERLIAVPHATCSIIGKEQQKERAKEEERLKRIYYSRNPQALMRK